MVTNEQIIANRRQIGRKMAEIRKAKGLTIKEIEQRTGLRFQNISRIESGLYSTGIDLYYKIAGALGVELKELF